MKVFVRRAAMCGVTAALAMVFATVAKPSLAQHFDVLVTRQTGQTKLFIGGYDDGAGISVIPDDQMRVFEGEVVPPLFPPDAPYETEAGEPGFRAWGQTELNAAFRDFVPGADPEVDPIIGVDPLFPPGFQYQPLPDDGRALTFSSLSMTINGETKNLFFWDGLGPVDFQPVPDLQDVVLTLSGPGGSMAINETSAAPVTGFTIATTGSGGSIHEHLDTSIGDAGAAPDQGFYLFSLQMGMTGFTSSDPLYFVFGALDPGNMQNGQTLEQFEDAHGLAATWVQNNLVAPVPEPSTYALMGLAAVALPLVRRFRKRR